MTNEQAPELTEMTECSEATEDLSPIEALPPSEQEASEESDPSMTDPILQEVASLRAELSELRHELELRRLADEVNRRNAALSAGPAGKNVAPEYYTPDEVRAMSPAEVRENYPKIRASMKRWH